MGSYMLNLILSFRLNIKKELKIKKIRHSIKIIVFRIVSIQNWRNRKVVFNVNNNWIIISPMDIQKVKFGIVMKSTDSLKLLKPG